MSFEHGAEDPITTFGLPQTPEQKAAEIAARADAEVFREQRKREMAKEKAEVDKAAQTRAAEILEKNAIEVFLEVNPGYSWHGAKYLFDSQLRELIAIENFKSAYFGQKQTGFDDVRM